MNAIAFLVAVIVGLMLAEQRVSRRNERRLRAAGAIEPPGDVYRALAILYPAAFLAMGIEGMWHAQTAPDAATLVGKGPFWPASGALLFLAGKVLKYWAIWSFGERWSFKVYVQPGRPLVDAGPYRYVAHPNYIGVVGELAGTAMMVGARWSGPVVFVVMALLLRARIRFEERALAMYGGQGGTARLPVAPPRG